VSELTRALIAGATREKRFRPRAVRIDSTVIEADIKHPTDAGLASAGVRVLAREGRKLAALVGERRRRVRDRSRAMGRRLRAIGRTIRRRSGEAKAEVLKLTDETGELLRKSVKQARELAAVARRRARGRGARTKLRAAAALEQLADRCEKVARQITKRVAGEPISDRIVSLFDPQARPIRKGKLGKPNEFGYVTQLAEVTENTRRGARGLILPASTQVGNPAENTLLPTTVAELERLGIRPREVALDGGFTTGPTNQALEPLEPDRVFIAGRQQPDSRRTGRRLRRYRTGAEAASATSSAATAWTAAASKATRASRSGLNGRSSPTTPTHSPSEPAETLQPSSPTAAKPTHHERPRTLSRGRFVTQEFFRGK
jgi:IS5 family transposase